MDIIERLRKAIYHDNYGSLPADAAAEIERLRSALEAFIYETTHLSPRQDDGSHRCKISRETLESGRAALRGEEG